MPRSLWTGSIGFGLVNIPIQLFPAVARKEVHFHQLHAVDGGRIQQRRFCSIEKKEVPYQQITKGYEVSKGRYVTVSPEELESVAPKSSRVIELEFFVPLKEIDPIYFEQSYLAAPAKGAGKAFVLLLESLQESGRVGVGRGVLRTRECLCAVRPYQQTLAITTLLYGDEIVDASTLEQPASPAIKEKERRMAASLIDALSARFEPRQFEDLFRNRVLELIENKAEGKELVVPAVPEEGAVSLDLLDALEQSVASRRRLATHGELRAPRKTAAKTARAPKRRRS